MFVNIWIYISIWAHSIVCGFHKCACPCALVFRDGRGVSMFQIRKMSQASQHLTAI